MGWLLRAGRGSAADVKLADRQGSKSRYGVWVLQGDTGLASNLIGMLSDITEGLKGVTCVRRDKGRLRRLAFEAENIPQTY